MTGSPATCLLSHQFLLLAWWGSEWEQGWQRLLAAKVLQSKWGEWYTQELLSDRTLLSPRTVAKIVGREVGVDRCSLNQFFAALDLLLETGDYRLAGRIPKVPQTLAVDPQRWYFSSLDSAV